MSSSKLLVFSALHTITGYNQLKPTSNAGTGTKAKTTEEPKYSQNIQERGILSLDIARLTRARLTKDLTSLKTPEDFSQPEG